jgi:hypothetical protein
MGDYSRAGGHKHQAEVLVQTRGRPVERSGYGIADFQQYTERSTSPMTIPGTGTDAEAASMSPSNCNPISSSMA